LKTTAKSQETLIGNINKYIGQLESLVGILDKFKEISNKTGNVEHNLTILEQLKKINGKLLTIPNISSIQGNIKNRYDKLVTAVKEKIIELSSKIKPTQTSP
jgi:hypothetical protein